MRHLLKSWKDQRSGWTRRVRWYDPGKGDATIRLNCEDSEGIVNFFTPSRERAQEVYEAFIAGDLTVTAIMALPSPWEKVS